MRKIALGQGVAVQLYPCMRVKPTIGKFSCAHFEFCWQTATQQQCLDDQSLAQAGIGVDAASTRYGCQFGESLRATERGRRARLRVDVASPARQAAPSALHTDATQ